jgi:molybdopterin-guanine dinucleotide biosynthesis protein B
VGRLAAAGLRVNVIKHSHHDVLLEPPHKAGAAEVMLASPFRVAIMRELRGEAEPGLAAQVARLAPADLTLVEGYKWEPIAKLEVFRPSVGRPALYPDDINVVAVASDAPRPDGLRDGVCWLDMNRPDAVLSWLSARLGAAA